MYEEQFPALKEFYSKEWKTFVDFVNDIKDDNQELFISGEGVIYIDKDVENKYADTFYLININDRIYAIIERVNPKTGLKKFECVAEMKDGLFESEEYKEIYQNNYLTKYNNFETKIQVEINAYETHEENRLMINKFDKVDLLYSIFLSLDNDSNPLNRKIAPNLNKSIAWQKKVDKLNKALNKAYPNAI